MQIPTELLVRLAHVNATSTIPLGSVLDDWHYSRGEMTDWTLIPEGRSPLLLGEFSRIIVDGDCLRPITAPMGSEVLILGDLRSSIKIEGSANVTVVGDVTPEARVLTNADAVLFVGGHFLGELEGGDNHDVWIEGNLKGILRPGSHRNRYFVSGDYRGRIIPGNQHRIQLNLTVEGFASQAAMTEIAALEYSYFRASLGSSDIEPGLYPADGVAKSTYGYNTFNCWCVRSQAAGSSVLV